MNFNYTVYINFVGGKCGLYSPNIPKENIICRFQDGEMFFIDEITMINPRNILEVQFQEN